MNTCKLDDCTNKHYNRGVCQGHYHKLLGTPQLPRLTSKKPSYTGCKIEGCDGTFYAKKMCRTHWDRDYRTGSPYKKTPEYEICGTRSSYSNGCRCEDCKQAQKEYHAEWSEQKRAELDCGEAQKYTAGCTCDECLEAYKLHLLITTNHGELGHYYGGCRCTRCKKNYSEWKADFYATNDEYRFKSLARGANKRAAEAGVEGEITWEDLKELYERYPECLRCGRDEELTMDHVNPISRGGPNTPENLQVLCRICNLHVKRVSDTDYRDFTPAL